MEQNRPSKQRGKDTRLSSQSERLMSFSGGTAIARWIFYKHVSNKVKHIDLQVLVSILFVIECLRSRLNRRPSGIAADGLGLSLYRKDGLSFMLCKK